MRRTYLYALTALILLMLSPLLRAAEAYSPGDRVVLIDAAGIEHLADIMSSSSNGWVNVRIDGDAYEFPPKSIQGKAGWGQRLVAAFTERSQAVKTYGITAAGVAAAFLGSQAQVASDKDTDQVDASTAATAATAAAESALVNGPATPYRYQISGTFTSSQPQATANGSWFPSITFGPASSGFRGGQIISATAPPSAAGAVPQVILGGSWVQVNETDISISDTYGTYTGRATLRGGGLTIRGVSLSGGSIAIIEIQ